MEEQKTKMTDEQLAQEMKRGKRGGMGGRFLTILGILLVILGVILGGSIPLLIAGAVLAALGEGLKRKKRDNAGQQVFDAMVPELIGKFLDNAEFSPTEHLVDADRSDIPLPNHTYTSGSGYIKGTYCGLPAELCNVDLTTVDEFQREETGMWERNEHTIYTGQWMVCDLGRTFPTGLTFWPRGKLDKLLRTHTIRTENETFNKRFNLGCDNEQWALQFLNQSRIERILRLTETAFPEFAVSLHCDGKLYIMATTCLSTNTKRRSISLLSIRLPVRFFQSCGGWRRKSVLRWMNWRKC